MLSVRVQAYAAELLSSLLIDTYHSKHAPKMKEDFALAGFSKESLSSSVDQLFLMIVTASYDRRPFSGYWGGYEYIWGMKEKENSIQARFARNRLSNLSYIRSITKNEITTILTEEKIKDVTLARVDNVDYARTLIDIASSVNLIHFKILQAKSSSDVSELYNDIVQIHGIGDTIASKLIKYTLREIGIGNLHPKEIPLSAAWSLTEEYHVKEAIDKLNALGNNIVPLAMGLLMKHGDPYAIDSLFFLNRFEQKTLEELITDIKQWSNTPIRNHPTNTGSTIETNDSDQRIAEAKKLLSVISDVCDDIKGITREQLKGLVQPNQLQAAARKLYANMANYASKGDIHNMVRYYENCLKTTSSWDWLLESIGRKCLKTEWSRFKNIYDDYNSR